MNGLYLSTLLFVLMACHSRPAVSQEPVALPQDTTSQHRYAWKNSYSTENKLINRIAPPPGYTRVETAPGSFAAWLRHLPLKTGKPDVHIYTGGLKGNQRAHFAVLDIDTGDKDLQQCADAVMRLRAEYLFAADSIAAIHFNFTNGFYCDFKKWAQGYRPVVQGNQVEWRKKADQNAGYPSFKKYLVQIFTYCGTQSLSMEMKEKHVTEIAPGDVFIRGGFPGHAVIVLDVAVNETSSERVFLLAQSYMPAQDMHILINPNDPSLSPWYSNRITGRLVTPEWAFDSSELKEF